MSDNNAQNDIFTNPETFHEAIAKAQQGENTAMEVSDEPTNDTNDSSPNSNIENESYDESFNDDSQNDDSHDEISQEVDNNKEEDLDDADQDDSHDDESHDQNKSHMIPKSRFNKEIEKRRAMESQLQEEREARIRMEAKIEAIQKLKQDEKDKYNDENKQKEPEIDPLDLESHQLYMNKIKELETKINNMSKASSHDKQVNQMTQVINNQEREFEKSHPDFQQALNHLQNVEMQTAMDMFDDEQQAQAYVHNKMQSTVVTGINKGKNVAEMMYNMSKRYGYKEPNKDSNNHSHNKRNVNAINRNMDKSASIRGVRNNANLSKQGMANIESAMKDPKNKNSGVDPNKFQALLKRAQTQYQ